MRRSMVVLWVLSCIAFAASFALGADLRLADFTYVGAAQIAGTGQVNYGCAYRPETDTFFIIATNGNDPYYLREIRLPPVLNDPAQKCVVVKDWGMLNVNGQLNIAGAMLSMRGLHWDTTAKVLWYSFGSFYSGANNPFFGYVKFNDDGTKTVYGPWRVADTIHSDTTKGQFIDTPCDILRLTGYEIFAFGQRGATAQRQSGGPGLVLVKRPGWTQPAQTEVAAKSVVHWPMKTIILSGLAYSYSDFPRDEPTTFITGPTSAPLFTDFNTYMQADGLHNVCVIGDTFVWTGSWAIGYSWYGGPTKYDALQLDSKIYPGQKMKSVSFSQGLHAEGYRPKIFLMRKADVISAYQTGNAKVLPYESGNTQMLGGVVPMATTTFGGTYHNETQKRFYAVEFGAPNKLPIIRVWDLAI